MRRRWRVRPSHPIQHARPRGSLRRRGTRGPWPGVRHPGRPRLATSNFKAGRPPGMSSPPDGGGRAPNRGCRHRTPRRTGRRSAGGPGVRRTTMSANDRHDPAPASAGIDLRAPWLSPRSRSSPCAITWGAMSLASTKSVAAPLAPVGRARQGLARRARPARGGSGARHHPRARQPRRRGKPGDLPQAKPGHVNIAGVVRQPSADRRLIPPRGARAS